MRNFLSYGNNRTTINLRFDDPTLVVGRNLDDMSNGQMESNGAGKTTIINALSWVLYDKTISNIKKEKLVNFINKKNMEVILIFKKDGKYYKIHRYRKNNSLGGDGVRIYESDKPDFEISKAEDPSRADISQDSIRLGTKQIERIVGMPFEIFVRVVIYSGSSESFFDLPVTSATPSAPSQSKIIEELFGITEVSEKGKVLKDELKEDKDALENLKKIGEEITKQKEMHQSQIDSVKNRISLWDQTKLGLIESIKAKIETLSNTDFEYQEICFNEKNKVTERLTELNSSLKLKNSEQKNSESTLLNHDNWFTEKEDKINSIKKKLSTFEEKDFEKEIQLMSENDDFNSEISTLQSEAKDFQNLITNADREMFKIADELEHLTVNKCPYCLQEMGKDSITEKINGLEKSKGDHYIVHKDNHKKLKVHQDRIALLLSKIEENKESLSFKSISELNNYRTSFTKLNDELVIYENQTNPYANVDITDLKDSIAATEKDIESITKELTKLTKKLGALNQEIIYTSEATMIDDRSKIDHLKHDLLKEEQSVNPHIDTLSDLRNLKIDDKNAEEIKKLEQVILHKTFLHKLLTKPDSFIRKTLLNQNLPFLNKQLKVYLDMLGLPHKVEFTEKMTADISKFENAWDASNLSRGQKARVEIALSFAFRDVLQKRYGKIAFCILDECLDNGLSSTGAQAAVKMIRKVAAKDKMSMLLITHREEITSMFDQVLEIELERGFSRILDSKISGTTAA